MVYQRHYWKDYDESKTETQNIEDGAVVTTEKLNELENGVVSNYKELDVKKTDKTYVDSMLSSIAQGGPKELFYSLAALKSKYPNGASGTFLVFDSNANDGAHSYMWDTASKTWKDLGVYQAVKLDEQAVKQENMGVKSIQSSALLYTPAKGKVGTNLFNIDAVIWNKTLNGRGLLQDNPYPGINFGVSDLIEVKPNTQYKRNQLDTAWLYNSDGSPISEATGVIFTTTDDTAYFRTVVRKNYTDSYMFYEGTKDIVYEQYQVFLDESQIQEGSIVKDKLANEFVEPELGKNLFDKSKTIKNSYISGTNGKVNVLANYQGSDFIELEPEVDYVKNNTQQFAFYSDKTIESFVSGVTSGNAVRLPSGAKYVRLTLKDAEADYLQLEKGTEATEFEPYGWYIQEHQISPGIIKKINEAASKIEFSVQLPSTIYLTVNEEFQIYWFNVISNYQKMHGAGVSVRVVDSTNTILGTIGEDTGDMWRYTPTSSGVRKITIRVVNDSTQEIINSKDVTLVAKSNLSVSLSKTVVTIGDSFTDGFGISKYFHDFVSSDPNKTLNMIGLNDSGKVGVKDNAWSGQSYKWFYGNDRGYLRSDRPLEDAFWDSGWGKGEANGWTEGQTYADLTEAQKAHGFTKNEFYNPAIQKFDFNYFMSTYMANAHVDGVVFILGLNDSIWENPTTLKNNLSVYKTRLDEMFNSIFAYDANINIIISLVTPQQQKDSFMRTYGTAANPWLTDSRAKRSQEIWNQFVLETYDTLSWKNKGLNVMATNAHFNTEYGLLTKEISPVKFDSTVKQRITRDVHPTEVGAKYIADCVRNHINSLIF
ncbi:SGNH/GDSL hydrolase family protein [Enterococcus entomosocium]|uniref:SGNH/GDSL hydrolase family protein n=1 Tax=Enterococcus entomosocium TaxID=3034352 RepID=UPI003D6A4FF1